MKYRKNPVKHFAKIVRLKSFDCFRKTLHLGCFTWFHLVLNALLKKYIPSHCVKSVRIRSFSGPNAGKYGPENPRIRKPFTQCS